MNRMKFLLLVGLAAGFPGLSLADNYTIDPDHTYPSLEMPHMGISIWRGKFNKTAGTVSLDRAANTGSVKIQVETNSIDFGHDKMNEHAVSADWLNVKKFPTMTYQGKLQFKDGKPVTVDGQLTLRGITKPLSLKINSFNCIQHPFYKKEACGADAEGDLNRADFGMTKYSEGQAGMIHLRIQVEALRDG